jgi:hypothetical protein
VLHRAKNRSVADRNCPAGVPSIDAGRALWFWRINIKREGRTLRWRYGGNHGFPSEGEQVIASGANHNPFQRPSSYGNARGRNKPTDEKVQELGNIDWSLSHRGTKYLTALHARHHSDDSLPRLIRKSTARSSWFKIWSGGRLGWRPISVHAKNSMSKQTAAATRRRSAES